MAPEKEEEKPKIFKIAKKESVIDIRTPYILMHRFKNLGEIFCAISYPVL